LLGSYLLSLLNFVRENDHKICRVLLFKICALKFRFMQKRFY